ncbi:MAG: hypothetical protein LDL41_20500 [Coleofasciculus sp. S288]|nr:hypothetical protein [Coleofasciculus sp. S288]
MKAIRRILFVSILLLLLTVGGVAFAQPLTLEEDTTSLSKNNIPDTQENRSLFFKTQAWSLEGNADTEPDINFLGTTDNQPLIIKTNNTEVMQITSDGNVGIGTSDPVAKLQVETESNEEAIAVQPSNSDEPMFSVDAMGRILTGEEQGTSSTRVIINAEDEEALRVRINGTTQFIVAPDGQVGIGTSVPAAKLQIDADNEEDDLLTIRSVNNEPMFSVDAMGRILAGEEQGTSSTRVTINAEDEEALRARINGTTQFIVAPDGQVGIGTSVPTAKLQIDADNEEDDLLAIRSVNNEPMVVVDSEGNVGIGTTSPDHELIVQGNDPVLQIRDDTTDNSANAARLELLERAGGNFDGGAFLRWNGNTNKLLIGTKNAGNDTNVLAVDRATSNVGIGTTNPQRKLHVQGGQVQVVNDDFARIRMTATNPSNDVQMFIDARGDGTNRGQLGTFSNHDLVMFTNNQARIVLGNDGNICIGNC